MGYPEFAASSTVSDDNIRKKNVVPEDRTGVLLQSARSAFVEAIRTDTSSKGSSD